MKSGYVLVINILEGSGLVSDCVNDGLTRTVAFVVSGLVCSGFKCY